MRTMDSKTLIFIIRLWIEPQPEGGPGTEWRGVIEHLPSRERRYVHDFDGFTSFIRSYLGPLQDQTHPRNRVFQWFRRLIRP